MRDDVFAASVLSKGLNRYVRNQSESVICQRDQNSMKLFAANGALKFSGILNPSNRPTPMTMSMYPEKLKYMYTRKAKQRSM